MLTAYDQTKKTPHQLLLTQEQTTLHLEKTYICPTEDINQLPYNYQSILYSQEPFLVTRQNDPKKKEQNKNTFIPPTGLPSTLSSQNLPTGGTGPDSDEDSFFKYPFRPPFVDQSGITMVLLPFLKLPLGWQHQIPGSQWYHWLIGEPDYDSGAIVNIQLNGESIARLPIHSWELQELAEDLTNSRQLLQKLAYRLNGRETFIQQLLDILATGDQNPMDEDTRKRIEKQLADVLEQSDHSFSLELEWFSLQAAMTPDNSIITAHNGKGKKQEASSGKTPGSSDQNQRGATGGQPSQSKQGKKETPDDRQNSNGPPPRSSKTGNHQKEGNPGTELTITFVGRMNAGKSSLASALLGAKFFPSDERRTETGEDDIVVTPDTDVPSNTLRIRSLPGYDTERTRIWLENNPIAADEIVVFVFRNSLSAVDVDVLRCLTRQNRHPLNQIIFVRNRFDEVVEAEKTTRKQTETMSSDEKASFVTGLQETLKAEFRGYMNRVFRDVKSFVCPELLFTDCRNIYQCNGMEPLLKAIKSSIQQAYPGQGREVIWTRFSGIREKLASKFMYYSDVFRQSFNHEDSIATRVLRAVRHYDPEVLNLEANSLDAYSSSLVKWFESEYQGNFDKKVTGLRFLSTLAIASSQKIKEHAEALLRKNEQQREAYLSLLHGQLNRFHTNVQSDPNLNQELGISAFYQAHQYTKEFRKTILKAMREHLWFWTSWTTSDEGLIANFKGHLSRAIEAEFLQARYQRQLQEPVYDWPELSTASHSFDSEPLLSEQSLQDGLNEHIEELVRQFTAILLSRIILPAYYHLPETAIMDRPALQPPLLNVNPTPQPPSRRLPPTEPVNEL
ncbi:GTPase [Endozoicomonas sp. 4G]|uniref:GTPase n=1 Tax=Endozoicomonas sp. 4G TaxID=2872754 RepID=UPI002078B21A|nr:GTPase [Endozoicomonas sp. 4G]